MHDPTVLIAALNERYGTDYHPLGAYEGGEQGAFAIVEGGRRAVLKWSPGGDTDAEQLALAVTARLRALAYPAPAYLLVGDVCGGTFTIQEELPGAPVSAPAAALLEPVLQLNGLQVGQAPPGQRTWPARILHTLREGGDGYCLHEPLRSWSDTTAALLATLQRIAEATDAAVPVDDVVHYDFTWANILAEGGAVSGVIDWGGTCAGDRAFDLATLLFYSYADDESRTRLWDALDTLATPGVAALYLAHLILRQVDWSIRHHSPAVAASWIATGERVLADLRRRGARW